MHEGRHTGGRGLIMSSYVLQVENVALLYNKVIFVLASMPTRWEELHLRISIKTTAQKCGFQKKNLI